MEAGLTMEEQSRDIVYGKEKIRVILQFPETTEEMSLIKKEVSFNHLFSYIYNPDTYANG